MEETRWARKALAASLESFRRPEAGSEDGLVRDPMRIHLRERVDRRRCFAADQDAIRLLEVTDRRAFGEELGIREHVKGADAGAGRRGSA